MWAKSIIRDRTVVIDIFRILAMPRMAIPSVNKAAIESLIPNREGSVHVGVLLVFAATFAIIPLSSGTVATSLNTG